MNPSALSVVPVRRSEPPPAVRMVFLVLLAAGLGLPLVSCSTTTLVTPLAVAHPERVDLAADQGVPADVKTYTLPADWQYGTWVMKRGATVQFRRDGTGEFSAVVYGSDATVPDELHFQSVQYGIDGNILFAVPGNAVGLAMTIRQPFRDFPYEAKFGFDPRHFDSIVSARFLARLRLEEGAGASATGGIASTQFGAASMDGPPPRRGMFASPH